MPTCRNLGGTTVTSAPEMQTVPSSGAVNPAMILRRVVLPEPLGPSSVANAPSGTSRSMPRRTSAPENAFLTPLRLMAAERAWADLVPDMNVNRFLRCAAGQPLGELHPPQPNGRDQ